MSTRKLDEDIRNSYPYPLAATFHRAYFDTRDVALIHEYVLDLFEVSLKYVTACVLAQYVGEGAGDEELNEDLLQLQRPSLELWQGWLRAMVHFYARRGEPLLLPEIGVFWAQAVTDAIRAAYRNVSAMMTTRLGYTGDVVSVDTITTAHFFALLGQYRMQAAQVAPLSGEEKRAVVEWLLPAMRDVLTGLDFLRNYRLVLVNEVKVTAEGRTLHYEHYVTDLMGYRPSVVSSPYVHDAPAARPGELCVSAKDQDFAPLLSLHPFLICRYCRECSDDQVFALSRNRENRLIYISYQCSHRFALSEFMDDITTVLGLLQQPELRADDTPPVMALADVAESLEQERRRLEEERRELAQLRGEQAAMEHRAPVDVICPHCGRLNRQGLRFCTVCGSSLAGALPANPVVQANTATMIACPRCGHPNVTGLKFCTSCGLFLVPAHG